jgi:DNA-binding transcriptional MerR regulator
MLRLKVSFKSSLGLLKPAERVAGQRHYSSESVDRVLLIRFASDMGFTLNETEPFMDGE